LEQRNNKSRDNKKNRSDKFKRDNPSNNDKNIVTAIRGETNYSDDVEEKPTSEHENQVLHHNRRGCAIFKRASGTCKYNQDEADR